MSFQARRSATRSRPLIATEIENAPAATGARCSARQVLLFERTSMSSVSHFSRFWRPVSSAAWAGPSRPNVDQFSRDAIEDVGLPVPGMTGVADHVRDEPDAC